MFFLGIISWKGASPFNEGVCFSDWEGFIFKWGVTHTQKLNSQKLDVLEWILNKKTQNIIMKTVCPHKYHDKYHHDGFVVHTGDTNERNSLHQALRKEHNINFSDLS